MRLDDYLKDAEAIVREELQAMLPRDSARTGNLYKLMLEYPLRHGKFLRPALSLAVCRARGGEPSQVLPTAAVLELYHNAFLIHDDVEDQSEVRRSEPTLHRKYGLPIAVNVGDGMLAIAIRPLLDNTGIVGLGKTLKILDVIARMAQETAEGQMIELSWVRSGEWIHSDADYVRLVYKKTAWYSFVAPIMVGAIVAGLPDIEVRQLKRMAIHLGIAFQIQDDILNLSAKSDTYGKDFCGDLWEGKHTLILIHALRSAAPAERSKALAVLRKPMPLVMQDTGDAPYYRGHAGSHEQVEVKSEDEINFLRHFIDRHDSISYAWTVAHRYASRFQRELQRMSEDWAPSIHKDFLLDLANFTIRRTH